MAARKRRTEEEPKRKPTKLVSEPWFQQPEGSDTLAQKAYADVERLRSMSRSR